MNIAARVRKLEDQAAPARPLTWAGLMQAITRQQIADQTGRPPAPADVAYCARFLAAYPALVIAATEGGRG